MYLGGVRAQGGTLKMDVPENREKHLVHRRFYVSLMLRDLINEVPIHHVAIKYEMARGFVQTLAASCKGFATTTGTFCKKMGWSGLAVLLDHYAHRLEMGSYIMPRAESPTDAQQAPRTI